MPDSPTRVFESYRLDLRREHLWRGQEVITRTNKAFAVLHCLVEHAEQLVTRDALMEEGCVNGGTRSRSGERYVSRSAIDTAASSQVRTAEQGGGGRLHLWYNAPL